MSHVHSLHFESLEARELLSTTHPAAAHAAKAHAKAAVATVPLVLDGTLTVNNSEAISDENLDGGYTTSVPVSRAARALGQVTGVWYESTDAYGDYLGPDTITLHGAQGAFTIAFNNGVFRTRPPHRPPLRLLSAHPADPGRHGRLLRRHGERDDRPEHERRAYRGREHHAERPEQMRPGGEPVHLGGEVLDDAARGDRAGPPGQARDAHAPLPGRALSLAEQARPSRLARFWISQGPLSLVKTTRVELGQPRVANRRQDLADAPIDLLDDVAVQPARALAAERLARVQGDVRERVGHVEEERVPLPRPGRTGRG